ncbi:UNVERIFIED_ORG: hypothetical protein GGE64_005822 [Rhizobium etli]
MADYREAFIGIDVAKLKNAIAVAESGREGEVRFWGEVDASDTSMRRIIQRTPKTWSFIKARQFLQAHLRHVEGTE